jgi:hypothetical protein
MKLAIGCVAICYGKAYAKSFVKKRVKIKNKIAHQQLYDKQERRFSSTSIRFCNLLMIHTFSDSSYARLSPPTRHTLVFFERVGNSCGISFFFIKFFNLKSQKNLFFPQQLNV